MEFTDEEGYGKYLDLHEVYDKFLNLRGVEVRRYCNITVINSQLMYRMIVRNGAKMLCGSCKEESTGGQGNPCEHC